MLRLGMIRSYNSWYDVCRNGAVQVVSLLYGIVLSLLGFILPLSEAVEHGWLNLTYGAVRILALTDKYNSIKIYCDH